MARLELWQFQHSHFCEKARWMLEHKQLAFEQRTLVPGLHIGPVMRATRQKGVPVLFIDGEPVVDSARIAARLDVDHPERPLLPADPAVRERAIDWERRLGRDLGPFIRRAWIRQVIDDRDYALAVFSDGGGDAERRRFERMWPVFRAAFWFDMKLTRRGAARGWERTRAMLDELAAAVEPTGYLAGDAFSIADLTAVALLAPILPKQWRVLGEPIDPPPALAAVPDQFADHPAMVWARQIYREHRGNPRAA